MVLFTPNINASLAAGETERWVVQTTTKVAARVTLSANGQPYDVDVATAENEPRPGDFDTGNYDTSLPTGAITISDTDEHIIGVDAVDNSIYVEVTNNSGSQITVSGSIYLLSAEAASSVEQFTTQRVGERSNAWLDGKGLENAREVRTEFVVDDSSGASYDVDTLAAGEGEVVSVSDDGVEVVNKPRDINFGTDLDATDDGDATVTVDANVTLTSVSDNGGEVVAEVADINFGTDLDATDDGDGTVTVDADVTLTGVSDDGTAVYSEVSDINFANNLTVTDDTDGTVTVDGTGDPADISDDTVTVVTAASDINFGTDLTATDDGDGTVTVDAVGAGVGTNVANGTDAATSGSVTVSTGVTDQSATLFPAFGAPNVTEDITLAAREKWDESAGEYKFEFFEQATSVGSFDVKWDIIRVS